MVFSPQVVNADSYGDFTIDDNHYTVFQQEDGYHIVTGKTALRIHLEVGETVEEMLKSLSSNQLLHKSYQPLMHFLRHIARQEKLSSLNL